MCGLLALSKEFPIISPLESKGLVKSFQLLLSIDYVKGIAWGPLVDNEIVFY